MFTHFDNDCVLRVPIKVTAPTALTLCDPPPFDSLFVSIGALTRPGRFDRTINVELPDIKGRKSIFDVHLQRISLAGPLEDFSPRLAALTPGFSGADIANICNEAAIQAGRMNKKAVDMVDFEKATDRVIGTERGGY